MRLEDAILINRVRLSHWHLCLWLACAVYVGAIKLFSNKFLSLPSSSVHQSSF